MIRLCALMLTLIRKAMTYTIINVCILIMVCIKNYEKEVVKNLVCIDNWAGFGGVSGASRLGIYQPKGLEK